MLRLRIWFGVNFIALTSPPLGDTESSVVLAMNPGTRRIFASPPEHFMQAENPPMPVSRREHDSSIMREGMDRGCDALLGEQKEHA